MKLITRPDFDGLVCAVFLRELNKIGEIEFRNPPEIQDGSVSADRSVIVANLPYVENCGLWFDHHASEELRGQHRGKYKGSSQSAPSAARLVYRYFSDDRLDRFHELLLAVDRADSGKLTEREILNPAGWILLALLTDPRTGLIDFAGSRIAHEHFLRRLVDAMQTRPLEEILELREVHQRIECYRSSAADYQKFLIGHSAVDREIIVTDLREIRNIPPGNRYMVYAMFPKANISITLANDKENPSFTVISVGHSILNRSSLVNVGVLLHRYGGGGHMNVGTCRVLNDSADVTLQEIKKLIFAHVYSPR